MIEDEEEDRKGKLKKRRGKKRGGWKERWCEDVMGKKNNQKYI
jgi:hypothetical protein